MSDRDLVQALISRSVLHGITSDVMNILGNLDAENLHHDISVAYLNIASYVCLAEKIPLKEFDLD